MIISLLTVKVEKLDFEKSKRSYILGRRVYKFKRILWYS
jgi:hypothetical protein